MVRVDLLENLNRILSQKIERMETLLVLLENLDDTVNPALMKPALETIETLQKQLFNGDVLFLSILDKFLKENGVRSLGELSTKDLVPLKFAQSYIREADGLQKKINPELERFEALKKILKESQTRSHQSAQINRAYGKK